MHSIELTVMALAMASIVWGVLKYFTVSQRLGWGSSVVAAIATAGFVNQAWQVWDATPTPGRSSIAVALYAGSLLLFWATVLAHGSNRPAAIFDAAPNALVRTGPYRLVRHPFYASYALFWWAGWVGTETVSTACVAAIMTTVYALAARAEERAFAHSPLAAAYSAYRLGH